MNLKKLNLAMMAVLPGASIVVAEETSPVTANIGVVSNYIWRGVTQTQNDPAIQGGVDYAHESGFSLGTWVSNVDFGTDDPNYEWDIYAGYGAQLDDFGYNLTTAYYAYPDGKDLNFWDVGASGTWSFLTVGLSYTLDDEVKGGPSPFREGDLYYYGSLAFDLPVNFKLSGTFGHYDFDKLGDVADYNHWQISLSKNAGDFGTFSLNYDQTDGGDGDIVAVEDDPTLSIGWKKVF